MEYIKKEELIIGEIYKSTLYNHIFKYLDKNGDKNPNLSKTYNMFKKDLATIGHGLNNIINTTSEEKHWLNCCITANKSITLEEAMKTFIPEYVELLNNGCRINNNISSGKIYKCSKDVTKTYHYGFLLDNKHRIGFNENEFDRYLKPSTKEAYDAQFVVKDPEFVLPEKWCIKFSHDKKLLDWCKENTQTNFTYFENLIITNDNYFHYPLNTTQVTTRNSNYTEITFEQFKKYVLKEEVIEEVKVIEPLPQFKVIESIETITKVENNEGNQFFIGDVVISDSGFVQTIKSFRYNVNKDNVLATTNVCNQISIARLEHYIEPKVEETLLEKAKRLYPIGTKFKSATSKRIFTIKNHIQEPCQNPNTIVFSTNEINANGKFYACVHSHICEWAEIINE